MFVAGQRRDEDLQRQAVVLLGDLDTDAGAVVDAAGFINQDNPIRRHALTMAPLRGADVGRGQQR
jgi:hypothetical protein